MSKESTDIIYGIHAVEAALRKQPQNILQVFVQQGRNDKRFQQLSLLAKKTGISVQLIHADKIKKKCPDSRHQGVVAQIRVQKKIPLNWRICSPGMSCFYSFWMKSRIRVISVPVCVRRMPPVWMR